MKYCLKYYQFAGFLSSRFLETLGNETNGTWRNINHFFLNLKIFKSFISNPSFNILPNLFFHAYTLKLQFHI